MQITSLALGIFLGAILAASLLYAYFRSQLFSLKEQLSTSEKSIHSYQLQVTTLDAQKKDFQSLSQQMTDKFEALAGRIFEDKSTRFADQNMKSLTTLLEPFK